MSQVESDLLHQLNVLSTAVVLLVLCLAAAIGAAATFAQAWSKALAAAAELRSWYRNHSQQRTVEGLMREQLQREMRRAIAQPDLPSGMRQREPEARPPASSKPPPLDQTWPSLEAGRLAQPHSGMSLAAADKPHTPRPPPLPEPAPGSDWADSDLKTERGEAVADAVLMGDAPANDESDPIPLVKQLMDKQTVVWPLRKLPRID